MDTTTTNTTLYTNQNTGEFVCLKHAGASAQHEIAARPEAQRWTTPFGTITRWTAADDADWIATFGKPAQCETCRFKAR